MEKEKPPSTKTVIFFTNDGKSHHGFYLESANKYVTGIRRWKDVLEDRWYDDKDVTDWSPFVS